MDDRQFDHLVRAIATPSSRRKALGAIGAALLSLTMVRQSSARTCSPPTTACREHATCCSGVCGASSNGRRACALITSFFVSAFEGQDSIGLATGLILTSRQTVTISATDAGANCNIYDIPPGCIDGPNGRPEKFQDTLAPNLDIFALIARVGNGPWVKVGVGPTTISGNGQLFLAYNDLLPEYKDNAGGFNVSVQIIT